MDIAERLTPSPAEIYEERFVPALFGQWGAALTEMAAIRSGQAVLDVACGTGAAARAAAVAVGGRGRVTGLDPNADMLAVARRKFPAIEWREGSAERLPFEAGSFDAVISQFGLMFFDDRVLGLQEMVRVLRPGGRLAVAVCDALDHSPGYAVFAELLQRLFGSRVAEAFRAPFVLGDERHLRGLCDEAGIPRARVERRDGTVRFASVHDLVSTERACAWTLGGILDDEAFERLADEAEAALRPFTEADGRVSFNMPTLIITARKGGG